MALVSAGRPLTRTVLALCGTAGIAGLGFLAALHFSRVPPASLDRQGAAPPARIVVITTGIVDDLGAMGLLDRVVGVSARCRLPGTADKVQIANDFGAGTVNVEAVMSLHPDLFIAEQRFRSALAASGIPGHFVPDDMSWEDLPGVIEDLGRAVQEPERAQALVERMESQAAGLAAAVAGLPPVRVYFEYGAPGESIGSGTIVDSMIRLAGGSSISAGTSLIRPVLSNEAIVKADPEVIVLSPFTESEAEALRRPGWSAISAVRDGRVHKLSFEERGVMLYSWRCVDDAARRFLPWFHPEVADRGK